MPYGPDISNNNGRVDWQKLAGSKKAAFVFAKATEGLTFHDGFFNHHRVSAEHFKIPFGAYHFAHPDNRLAVNEAAFFCAALGNKIWTGELRPVLDLETSPGLPGKMLRGWAERFCAEVEKRLRVRPLLYTYPWYCAHIGGWPKADLWIADLSHKPPAAPKPAAVCHQFQWHARLPGISGEVDYNYAPSLAAIRVKL